MPLPSSESPRTPDTLGDYRRIQRLFRISNTSPGQFILPVLLSLSAALMEGVSIGLLIPLLKGLLEADFSFLNSVPLLSSILAPFIAGKDHPDITAFGIILIFILAVGALRQFLEYLSNTTVDRVVFSFTSKIRKEIFARFLTFGKRYFDSKSGGNIQNIALNFTEDISRALRILSRALNSVLLGLVYASGMLIIFPSITLAVGSILAFLNYMFKKTVLRVKRFSISESTRRQELARQLANFLSVIPLVNAYANASKELARYSEVSDEIAQIRIASSKNERLIAPIQEFFSLVMALLLICGVGVMIFFERKIETASLLVYLLMMRRTITYFANLGKIHAEFFTHCGALGKICEIFDDEGKHFIKNGSRPFSDLEDGIEFRGLKFGYTKAQHEIKNISFIARKGELTAIVGPSGSGKSTLASLLMRSYDCEPGMLSIDGTDIREFDYRTLRRRIAHVSQDALLFNATIRENLTYGLSDPVSNEKLEDVCSRARLLDWIKRLPDGFDTEIGDRGLKLSGGEKQRLAIARAILKEAPIIILDEATSALDSKTEHLVQEAVDEACKNRTALVIAHRLSTIIHADRIVVIDEGRSVEQGTSKALLETKGKFHQLWQAQRLPGAAS